jgi:glycosyltransferase involved in cell wall biosynthesis
LRTTLPRPLRFCFLSGFYPPYSFGGDAIYLYRLADSLARRGHEIDVIHCVDSYRILARRKPQASFLSNHPNVTVHRLRSPWGLLSPIVAQQTGRTWPKTSAIMEIFFSKKFDVIHYHNISMLGPGVLRLQPDYRDFIKLYTTHEHWLVCPMHVLWKNNQRPCESPECFRCTLTFNRPPQWWRYTNLLKDCVAAIDTFVSPSIFTRDMHHQRGFNSPMTVIPNFVSEIAPASEPDTTPHPRPYFLFVGRLEKIKGVEKLLHAFAAYPQADLVIAGTGTIEKDLRAQARNMSNVRFLGQLPGQQLQNLYHHAIAVLLPSAGYEVFPLVALEAFQCRTPVIAHALGGLVEILEQSRAGFLYQDPAELLSALAHLQSDPGLRQEMGERGYAVYQEKWTESAHLANYFKVLEETAIRKLGAIPWDHESQTLRGLDPHGS